MVAAPIARPAVIADPDRHPSGRVAIARRSPTAGLRPRRRAFASRPACCAIAPRSRRCGHRDRRSVGEPAGPAHRPAGQARRVRTADRPRSIGASTSRSTASRALGDARSARVGAIAARCARHADARLHRCVRRARCAARARHDRWTIIVAAVRTLGRVRRSRGSSDGRDRLRWAWAAAGISTLATSKGIRNLRITALQQHSTS